MNYYQASTTPMGANPQGYPSQGVVNALRRSGFWASFLGWSSILTISGVILLLLFVPTLIPKSKAPVNQPSFVVEEQDAQAPTSIPAPISGDAREVGTAGALTLVLGGLTLLSAIGMVIMLVWFGAATKKLLRFPTFDELHRVAVLQRRLWICIGIYSICNLIPLVLSLIGAAAGLSQMWAGVE
jgi:uncharacterized membrane protein